MESLENNDDVIEFLEVQGGVGERDAVWGRDLTKDIIEHISKTSVFAAISIGLVGS